MTVVINGTTGVSTPGVTNSGSDAITGNQTVAGRSTFATTIGVGNATPSTSGSGITFPATQSASTDANTLDDYEEGTFTPTIRGISVAGTGTYTAAVGVYTKIGDRCFFQIWLDWTDITGASGAMIVGGLPFTATSITNAYSSASVYMDRTIVLPASHLLQGYIVTGNNIVYLSSYAVGGGSATSITLDSNAAIMVTGSYKVA